MKTSHRQWACKLYDTSPCMWLPWVPKSFFHLRSSRKGFGYLHLSTASASDQSSSVFPSPSWQYASPWHIWQKPLSVSSWSILVRIFLHFSPPFGSLAFPLLFHECTHFWFSVNKNGLHLLLLWNTFPNVATAQIMKIGSKEAGEGEIIFRLEGIFIVR